MTLNQQKRVREWLDKLREEIFRHDHLPVLVMCYPADDEDLGLALYTLPIFTDQQVAESLREALLTHCAAKGIVL